MSQNNMSHNKMLNQNRRVLRFDAGEDRTQQQYKDECDINSIIRKYCSKGVLPQDAGMRLRAIYCDVSNPQYSDLRSYMEAMREADKQWELIPAAIRRSYGNDWRRFAASLDHPEGVRRAISLGLIPQPDKTAGTTPATGAAAGSPPSPDVASANNNNEKK